MTNAARPRNVSNANVSSNESTEMPSLSGSEDVTTNDAGLGTTDVDVFNYLLEAIRNNKIHKLRSTAPIAIFKRYCELCLPIIVGKQQWKINHTAVGVRALTTVADEALIALVLENNIEEWVGLAQGRPVDPKNRLTLYTHGRLNAKAGKKGWSLEGRKRYNVLHAEVKQERTGQEADTIDESLKEMWKRNKNGDLSASVSATAEEIEREKEEDEFQPVYEFDD